MYKLKKSSKAFTFNVNALLNAKKSEQEVSYRASRVWHLIKFTSFQVMTSRKTSSDIE